MSDIVKKLTMMFDHHVGIDMDESVDVDARYSINVIPC